MYDWSSEIEFFELSKIQAKKNVFSVFNIHFII